MLTQSIVRRNYVRSLISFIGMNSLGKVCISVKESPLCICVYTEFSLFFFLYHGNFLFYTTRQREFLTCLVQLEILIEY